MRDEDRRPIGVYLIPLLLIGTALWAGLAWGLWVLFH